MQFDRKSPVNQDHNFLKKKENNRFRLTFDEFLSSMYVFYRDFSAGKRGYEFSLTHDEIKKLIVGAPCFYCGKKPMYSEYIKDCGKIVFNGIDRVDNSLGYVSGNVVACCKQCNTMKSNVSLKKFQQMSEMYGKIKAFLGEKRNDHVS